MIDENSRYRFFLSTKWPERLAEFVGRISGLNLVASVSASTHKQLDAALTFVREAPLPFKGLMLSPLVEAVPDLAQRLTDARINIPDSANPRELSWVLTGGEQLPIRDFNRDTSIYDEDQNKFRSLRDQCKALAIPFYFIQWGRYIPPAQSTCGWASETYKSCKTMHYNFLRDGRCLDGVEHSDCPEMWK
jgi:protein gp37